MNELGKQISSLPDETARRVLATIAQARMRRGTYETELNAELRNTLRIGFELGDESGIAGEGDLAREALLFLASDPENRETIAALVSAPPPERFAVLESVALVTAVLVALQTHVRFERDKDGRFTLKIEKKPTSTQLLKPLVAKLLALAGG